MNKIIIICVALFGTVTCEPPVSFGGGGYGGGGGGFGGNDHEGQIPGPIVDQHLLNRITNILNQQENQGGYNSGPASSYGAPPPLSSYGPPPAASYGPPPAASYGPPPSAAYGAPAHGNIQLGRVSQGILVAKFDELGQGGYGGGSGGHGGGGGGGGYSR